MSKIGLFYGPTKGSVENVAFKIVKMVGADRIDLVPVHSATFKDLNAYESIIFGISTLGRHTWSSEMPSSDWDDFLPELDKMDYKGKTFAMYGLGDHVTYAHHFVDALGVLADKIKKHKGRIIGQCPTDDYEFVESEAVIDGSFVGLPLDEDFEPEKTDGRIKQWLDRILPEML